MTLFRNIIIQIIYLSRKKHKKKNRNKKCSFFSFYYNNIKYLFWEFSMFTINYKNNCESMRFNITITGFYLKLDNENCTHLIIIRLSIFLLNYNVTLNLFIQISSGFKILWLATVNKI